MPNPIIEVKDLSKVYKLKTGKDLLALDHANFEVQEGEIFGLLGPNGAGKTTLISMLSTLLSPTSGTAIIDGYDLLHERYKVKQKIGIMLESSMIYYRITGYNNLKFFAKLYQVPDYKVKIADITEKLGLKEWLNQYAETYSSGMKMKLALARVILVNPRIFILDEPTLGLDIKMVNEIADILKSLNRTILVTSHDLNFIQKLCTKIAFINKGRILKIDTPENMRQFLTEELYVHLKLANKVEDFLKESTNVAFIKECIQKEAGVIHLRIKNRNFFPDLFSFLQKYPVTEIYETKPTLEEILLKFF